jgi:uncharacterized protein YdhG (YjbR/CyaY superfamily)
MTPSKNVDTYIEKAPDEARPKLKEIRAAITEVASDAVESISYGMPHYSFKGESGFKSRLCYFGLTKSKKRIAFYGRPVFFEEYADEVKPYSTSKSALQFPLDGPIPVTLIKKLVKNGIRKHKTGSD